MHLHINLFLLPSYYIVEHVILILILKSMKGIIVHRRPQLIKLSTLLDFYQEEPESQYRLFVHNGYLKTDISGKGNPYSSSQYRDSKPQQQYSNVRGIDIAEKKTVGLFSNLIKKMDTNRQNIYEQRGEQQQYPKKKPYEFYFRQFQNQNEQIELKQMEGTSIKKIKERATGFINVSLKRQSQSKQNKRNQINEKNQQYQMSNKQPLIDINFSFEEISNQLEEKKNIASQIKEIENFKVSANEIDPPLKKQPSLRNQQKAEPQINKLLPSLMSQPNQSSKQLSIPQSFIPSIGFSVEEKKEIFAPIPHKSRHEIRINNEGKIETKNLKKQSKPLLSVEGAKKAQSRVYNKSEDSKDIKIDFDFQIDI